MNWFELRTVLAQHDIPTLFRVLCERGMSQRHICDQVGMNPSEVSEIIKGRQVRSYDVLLRIADGLRIPHGLMGLAYAGEVVAPLEGVPEDVKRRAFLATASIALVGRPVLGEVLELPTPPDSPTPLPSQVGMGDVRAISDMTERMRSLARHYGGQGHVVSGIAHRASRLMEVPANDRVRAFLGSTLSELHTLAGWCGFDSGFTTDASRAHFTKGMEFASSVTDHHRAANAIYHAGMAIQNDSPNDSLKLLQLAQLNLGNSSTNRETGLNAWLDVDSAHAYAMMDHPRRAHDLLRSSQDRWQNSSDALDEFDRADMDHVVAQLHMTLGSFDTAEQLAQSSVRTWADSDRRDGAQARTTLATLHVMTGESDGPRLAQRAINDVAELHSSRAYTKLAPLHDALSQYSNSTCQDLAHRITTLRA